MSTLLSWEAYADHIWKVQVICRKGYKILWKQKNMLVTSIIYFFSYNDFERFLPRRFIEIYNLLVKNTEEFRKEMERKLGK